MGIGNKWFQSISEVPYSYRKMPLRITQFGRFVMLCRDAYKGRFWQWMAADAELVIVNYIRKIVNLKIAYLYGKGFMFKEPEADPSLANVDLTKNVDEIKRLLRADKNYLLAQKMFDFRLIPVLKRVFNQNNRELFLLQFLREGFVTGESWVSIGWDSVDKIPKFKIEDTATADFVADPLTNELKEVEFRYAYKDKKMTFWDSLMNRKPTRETEFEMKKLFTKKEIVIWDGRTKNPTERYKHSFGKVPVVYAKHRDTGFGERGESEIAQILPLTLEINEKKLDINEVLHYWGFPVLMLFGAKVKPGMVRSPDAIWELPATARVETLKLEMDLGQATAYLRMAKQMLLEMASIPEKIFNGEFSSVSHTSRSALALLYKPMQDDLAMPKASYEKALSDLASMSLSMLEKKKQVDLNDLPKGYKEMLSGKFQMFLPIDDLVLIQSTLQKLNANLISQRRGMVDIGIEDPEKMKEEIKIETIANNVLDGIGPQPGDGLKVDTGYTGVQHIAPKEEEK